METMPHQQQNALYWHTQSPPYTPLHCSAFNSAIPSPGAFQQQSPNRPNEAQLNVASTLPAIRNGSKKRRACNECKQQKLRCDLSTLVNHTSETCSRCKRLGLDCRIDRSFRRERKRKRSDELEKEVDSLKRELSRRSNSAQTPSGERNVDVLLPRQHDAIGSDTGSTSSIGTFHQPSIFSVPVAHMTPPELVPAAGPQGALPTMFSEMYFEDTVGKAVDAPQSTGREARALGNIQLGAEEIDELFADYFSYYHPFLPILDPNTTPTQYFTASPLLAWAIVSVGSRRYDNDPTLLTRLARAVTNLTWKTLQSIPHSTHVVQSLVLLCTWPFPTSSTSTDVSYMWAGTMMQISIQMGLHRPMNTQDFTKTKIQLSETELAERSRTWAACNIVAQSVSVGSGLAAPVQYDWSLITSSRSSLALRLDPEMEFQLRLEMFHDHVSRSMASNASDPAGLLPTHERLALYKVYTKELESIERSVSGPSDMARFWMIGARLHLQAFYLFDDPSSDAYCERILMLYFTATSLIQHTIEANRRSQVILRSSPFFVYQAFLSASCILFKILKNDYFSTFVDLNYSTKLFHASIAAIRRMSVADNDLPSRMGDVLTQLWKNCSRGLVSGSGQDGLELKVKTRGSVSIVFDLLARWREQIQGHNGDVDIFGPVGGNDEDDQELSEPATASSVDEPMPYAQAESQRLVDPNPGVMDYGYDSISYGYRN